MKTINIKNISYINLLDVYKSFNLNIPYGIFKTKVLKSIEVNDLEPIDNDTNPQLIEEVRQPEWLEYVTLVPASVINRLYSIMNYRVDVRKYSGLTYIKLNREIYFPLLANSHSFLLNELIDEAFKVNLLNEDEYTKLDDGHKAIELQYEIAIISLSGLIKLCHYFKLKRTVGYVLDILKFEHINPDIDDYIKEIPNELCNSFSIKFNNKTQSIIDKSRVKILLDSEDITSSISSIIA